MKSYLSIGLDQIQHSQDWQRAVSFGIARFAVTLTDRSSICGDRGNSDFNLNRNLGINFGFNSTVEASNFIHPETYQPSGRYRHIVVPT